jgi:hypothetical protein
MDRSVAVTLAARTASRKHARVCKQEVTGLIPVGSINELAANGSVSWRAVEKSWPRHRIGPHDWATFGVKNAALLQLPFLVGHLIKQTRRNRQTQSPWTRPAQRADAERRHGPRCGCRVRRD